MATTTTKKRLTKIRPTWCPGCGNYTILSCLNNSLDQLKLKPDQVVLVYDVGCSSNMADFVFSYGFHGLHGRALPVAAGIKLANPELQVIAIIGDGGAYGEGLNHLIGLTNGNHDISVIVHNNFSYSLTTGQKSPTTPQGTITPSTPQGNPDKPFNPIVTSLINHASFVSRGLTSEPKLLTELITAALKHTGFALVDVLQLCPTYNPVRNAQWYQKHTYRLDQTKHDSSNFSQALKRAQETDPSPLGIFYQQSRPTFLQQISLASQKPLAQQAIDQINLTGLLQAFA
jgi:2-oxoglutarate ferredoxin oxidoreductase subunit beta